MNKLAVVLFNLGGPDREESVAPFLVNLFSDPAIIGVPQPLRWVLARLIAYRRTPTAKGIYRMLGGGSPILGNTKAQATALCERLAAALPETDIRCLPAMRYWHPRADEIISELIEWRPERIVLLPFYPQFSTTTVQSSLDEWARVAKKAGLSGDSVGLCCYPDEGGFVEALARRTEEAIASVAAEAEPETAIRVLFSAHGLPQKVVAAGDPYQWQVERTAEAVVGRLDLPDLDWRVCYQSRVGPLEWLRPYTEDEIRIAGAEGTALVVVPVAFVSEHSETLVELDVEYRELAEEVGVPAYVRAPAVSTDGPFIDGLARLVTTALGRGAGMASLEGRRICPAACVRCAMAG